MTIRNKAVIWAAIILAATVVSVETGQSDSATWGIIAGLSGAAIGSLNSRSSCCWGGLQ